MEYRVHRLEWWWIDYWWMKDSPSLDTKVARHFSVSSPCFNPISANYSTNIFFDIIVYSPVHVSHKSTKLFTYQKNRSTCLFEALVFYLFLYVLEINFYSCLLFIYQKNRSTCILVSELGFVMVVNPPRPNLISATPLVWWFSKP